MKDMGIFIATVLYIASGFAWPALRLWRRHGVWPVVFSRRAAPAQRLFGLCTRVLLVVLLAASTWRLADGPAALGVRPAPPVVSAIGWALVGLGMLLTAAAQRPMGASWRAGIDDRPTDLATGGVFRLTRNPIFTGFLLFLAGYACLSPAGVVRGPVPGGSRRPAVSDRPGGTAPDPAARPSVPCVRSPGGTAGSLGGAPETPAGSGRTRHSLIIPSRRNGHAIGLEGPGAPVLRGRARFLSS